MAQHVPTISTDELLERIASGWRHRSHRFERSSAHRAMSRGLEHRRDERDQAATMGTPDIGPASGSFHKASPGRHLGGLEAGARGRSLAP